MSGGDLYGDEDLEITGAATIRDAKDGEITLVDRPNLLGELIESRAAAVVVGKEVVPADLPFIAVDDVHEAFGKIVRHFCPPRPTRRTGSEVSSSAWRHCPPRSK